jgi:plastocyanin
MVRVTRLALVVRSLLAVGALLALQAGSALAANREVDIGSFSFAFDPPTVRVVVGDSVTWRNAAGDPAHTATSDTGAWDSGDITPGGNRTVTFATAGTFAYHCRYHPIMKGTVVVREAGTGEDLPATDTSGSSRESGGHGDPVPLPVLLLLGLVGVLGAHLFLGRLDRRT